LFDICAKIVFQYAQFNQGLFFRKRFHLLQFSYNER
jgi:hypothetical protein